MLRVSYSKIETSDAKKNPFLEMKSGIVTVGDEDNKDFMISREKGRNFLKAEHNARAWG